MSLEIDVAARIGALEIELACETPDGGCLALAGPSGAGKSSILRIAAGLLRPLRGRVRCGDDVWLDTERGVDLPPERRRVGFVFQEYALFPHLSARQNIGYSIRGPGRGLRVDELLARFGLTERANALPRELSGGERQRVALARALAREPDALLLDEPLSALDVRTRAHAARELGAVLRESRVPAVLVTHDFGEAALLGDRVAIVDAGRIVQEGTAAELAARPASAFVADLTGASVLTGLARARGGGITSVALDGGGMVKSTEPGSGPVAVSIYPWEVTIEPVGTAATGSAQNRLEAEVVSVTALGSRVRLGLALPQPLAAEVTDAAVRALDLRPGARVVATFKAAATRLLPR